MTIHVSEAPMTFYHIARNAGSAISGYLLHHYSSAEWVHGTKYKRARHWTPWEANTFHFNPCKKDPGQTVCVVRNPFDRLVSQYYFLKAHPHMRDYKQREFDTSSFENWIYNGVWGYAYWPLQMHTADHCDFVIRYENLQEDFQHAMMSIFGEAHDLNLENEHALYSDEERLHYTEYYTDEMVDFVTNYFNKDLENPHWKVIQMDLDALGYSFGD